MKRTTLVLLFIIIIGFAFPLIAYADVGPKQAVTVDFKGLDGETYYATLLSRESTTGPYRVINEDEPYSAISSREETENPAVFKKFVEYKDKDGLYFIQFMQNCSETHRLNWSYHPPYEFKILIYFPETDTFVVSEETYEKYAFNSYFTADLSGQNNDITEHSKMVVTKSYNYGSEILSLIIRIILTIAIELGIARLFGLRDRKAFKFIVITNVVTQIILNITLSIINYHMGGLAFFLFYILLELFVFAFEAIIYTICLQEYARTRRLVLYALTANAASFFGGIVLAAFLSLIFWM